MPSKCYFVNRFNCEQYLLWNYPSIFSRNLVVYFAEGHIQAVHYCHFSLVVSKCSFSISNSVPLFQRSWVCFAPLRAQNPWNQSQFHINRCRILSSFDLFLFQIVVTNALEIIKQSLRSRPWKTKFTQSLLANCSRKDKGILVFRS